MELTARELAEKTGAELEGNGDVALHGVGDLAGAGEGEVTFVVEEKYLAGLAGCKASAAIVPKGLAVPEGARPPALLRAEDANAAFMAACAAFAPPVVRPEKGIHPSAVVSPEAKIGENVAIGALAVVEAGAEIGDGCTLYPQCYVGHGAKMGRDCILYPFAALKTRCVLGDRVILHSGAVVGSDGFGYVADRAGVRTKIPQVGIAVLEDDVEIGANACVDRARFGKTVVGRGTKVDNLVQIAHNCRIGEHSVLCAQVGMAGTTTLGAHVICAGQVGLAGHISVGDWAVIGAQSGVAKSLPGAQMYLGAPAVPRMDFARSLAHTASIPKLKEQVKALEARLAELEVRAGEGK
jgi:UDP-3-O-[3-hydroxymyristoyl] glucosamine N-acyltransferase